MVGDNPNEPLQGVLVLLNWDGFPFIGHIVAFGNELCLKGQVTHGAQIQNSCLTAAGTPKCVYLNWHCSKMVGCLRKQHFKVL